jgi:hypothetical protein
VFEAGTFDGGGHTLSHLTIAGTAYVGLFGEVGPSAQVLHLHVSDANITGDADHIAVITGQNEGILDDCHVAGVVAGKDEVGGLVGENLATCSNCSSVISVAGDTETGGLVGRNSRGQILACRSEGTVSRGDYVGGLVGLNLGPLSDCASTAAVSGKRQVGGLVGYNPNPGSVTRSHSAGPVRGTVDRIGGLAGFNSGDLSDCYSTGDTSGGVYVGGLVGFNQGRISSAYSTGKVSDQAAVGGLVGDNEGVGVVHCFWDTQTSGQVQSAAGTGLVTSALQKASTFLDAGWDLITVWTVCEGKDYPRLRWEGVQCEAAK